MFSLFWFSLTWFLSTSSSGELKVQAIWPVTLDVYHILADILYSTREFSRICLVLSDDSFLHNS